MTNETTHHAPDYIYKSCGGALTVEEAVQGCYSSSLNDVTCVECLKALGLGYLLQPEAAS